VHSKGCLTTTALSLTSVIEQNYGFRNETIRFVFLGIDFKQYDINEFIYHKSIPNVEKRLPPEKIFNTMQGKKFVLPRLLFKTYACTQHKFMHWTRNFCIFICKCLYSCKFLTFASNDKANILKKVHIQGADLSRDQLHDFSNCKYKKFSITL